MAWLFRLTLASMLGAVLVVKLYDVVTGGILGPLAAAAKKSLFAGTWTAITTGLGVHDAKKLRKKGVNAKIKPPLKDKRLK